MALSCLLQKANWKHTDWTGSKAKLSLLLIITTGYQPNLRLNLLFQSRFPPKNLQGVLDRDEMELIFPTAAFIVLSFVLIAGKVLVMNLCFVCSWVVLRSIRAVSSILPSPVDQGGQSLGKGPSPESRPKGMSTQQYKLRGGRKSRGVGSGHSLLHLSSRANAMYAEAPFSGKWKELPVDGKQRMKHFPLVLCAAFAFSLLKCLDLTHRFFSVFFPLPHPAEESSDRVAGGPLSKANSPHNWSQRRPDRNFLH